MTNFNRKKHWENIYRTKKLEEVSWYQKTPTTSIEMLNNVSSNKTDKIIDVGGGDSFLVDYLLDLGYVNITILDISEEAIKRAKERLGEKANKVHWIVSDIADFKPKGSYDIWHDRAAFHFLTSDEDKNKYVDIANRALSKDGKMIIGTFSKEGPTKCSGIEISQYTEGSLINKFKKYFDKISCSALDHKTPFETIQNFVFCSFKKKKL